MPVYFDDSYNHSSKKFTLLVLYLKEYDKNKLINLFTRLEQIVKTWKNSPKFDPKIYSKLLQEIKSTHILATKNTKLIEKIVSEIKIFINENKCI